MPPILQTPRLPSTGVSIFTVMSHLAEEHGAIVDLVFRAVRDLVHDSKEPRDEIINKAFWTYTTAEDVLKEINGYALRDNP